MDELIKLTQSLGIQRIVPCLFLILLLTNGRTYSQDNLKVLDQWIRFSDAPNALYHYLADQAHDLLDKRKIAISEIHSLPDWQHRQEYIRHTLNEIVGPFPDKSPLNPKITGTILKDGFRVENIIFESQPGLYVTSSLFIPDGLEGKAPAILYCSGHTTEGYRHPVYQNIILNLVKKGFIVFAFDPLEQGERKEYYNPVTDSDYITGAADKEHSYIGAQAFLVGSSLARHMIWDGIRAVDYLMTREEVDPARIGITGRSGGGTQSTFIAAFDERIYAAAPGNYITSFARLIESVGPQCAEQNLFYEIARGIDHADLLSVRAPKPILFITTTRDMFPIQGSRETAQEVMRIYEAYEKEDHFLMVEDNAPHASTRKGREATYAFFQEYLDNPGNPVEQDVSILNKNELQVTRTGQVSTSFNGETIYSLTVEQAVELADTLLIARKDLPDHVTSVLESAKQLSGYRNPLNYHEPVFMGRFQKEDYAIEKYFVKGEGDYVIPYLLIVPDEPKNKSLIYLLPSGKPVKSPLGNEIKWFVQQGFTVLIPDLIGTGETGPGDFRGDSFIDGVSYNTWFLSMLIGRSIVGIRTGDVVRLARLLDNYTSGSEVYGLAKSDIAPVLLYAAAFDTTISHVALIEPILTYRSIVMNRLYKSHLIFGAVANALRSYDLPGLAASVVPRNLLILKTKDGTSNYVDKVDVLKELSFLNTAYEAQGAGDQLSILSQKSDQNLYSAYTRWIK